MTSPRLRDVAVVVVNWNTKDMARRLAASLLLAREGCAKAGRNLRLIIVDNDSSDGSAAHLAEHASWAELIEAPRNGGFAYGVNLGVNAALASGTEPWCLLINTDAELEPSTLETFVANAEACRETAPSNADTPVIFGPQIVDEHNAVQRSTWPEPRLRDLLAEATLLGPVWRKLRGSTPPVAPARPACVSGCVFLIHPVALRAVGGFDEGYFLYFEETDFCTRVRATGATVAHLPADSFVHRGGLSAALDSERTFTTFRHSGVRWFAIHRGRLAGECARLLWLGADLVRGIAFAPFKPGKARLHRRACRMLCAPGLVKRMRTQPTEIPALSNQEPHAGDVEARSSTPATADHNPA